jgi:hypothetical protein
MKDEQPVIIEVDFPPSTPVPWPVSGAGGEEEE